VAVVTAWHILDGTPYTPAVIDKLRLAVRDFDCTRRGSALEQRGN
jgi:hypothetical protein